MPDASVLFAGDLLENAPAPAFGDSFPISWPVTGIALLALVDGVIVPGHGDPFDRGFAERQVAELDLMAELAREAASGASASTRPSVAPRSRRTRPAMRSNAAASNWSE